MARGLTPVWATIDAGNLGAFPYLYPVESVTVAVDHDPAGLAAFEKLAARWWAEATAAGITPEVRKVVAPRPGDDLNDWIRKIDDAR